MNFDIGIYEYNKCGLHSLGQNKRHEREKRYYIAFNRPISLTIQILTTRNDILMESCQNV